MNPGGEAPPPAPLTILPVTGIGEITAGADLAAEIRARASARDGDVLVVTQKIVSKAEGAVVEVDTADPRSHLPLIEQQSRRILRRRGSLLLTETHHGFVCANAGVDLSNLPEGWAALLPTDPDRSARRLRDAFVHRFELDVAVIVSDTFGRPWRRGVCDVAIGCAGLRPVLDLRGTPDAHGRELHVTEVAVADEIAAAAELVMGKSSAVPVAIVRGVDPTWFGSGSITGDVVRTPGEDLFR